MIKEDDEHFDPLLDGVAMAAHVEEDVDSESWPQNGMRGVDIKNPSHEKKGTIATQERTGTIGEAHSSGYSSQEQTVFYTTVGYGLTNYVREL